MEITTGRNTVNKASVSLRIPDDELSFDVTEATVLSRGEFEASRFSFVPSSFSGSEADHHVSALHL